MPVFMDNQFQYTPRMGGDDPTASAVLQLPLFIQPPHGGDWGRSDTGVTQRFNPRPRMGTTGYEAETLQARCFNPRPRMGGDLSGMF